MNLQAPATNAAFHCALIGTVPIEFAGIVSRHPGVCEIEENITTK